MDGKSLSDRMLVVMIEEKGKTTGVIIIADKIEEKQQEGKIASFGSGKWNENGKRTSLEVKKRDHVLFGQYAGDEVKIDVIEYLITREDDTFEIIL